MWAPKGLEKWLRAATSMPVQSADQRSFGWMFLLCGAGNQNIPKIQICLERAMWFWYMTCVFLFKKWGLLEFNMLFELLPWFVWTRFFLNLGSTDLFPPIPESFQRIPPPIRLQGLRAFGLASNKNGYDAGKSTRWVFLGGQITKGKDIWVFPNIGVPLFLETPIYTIYHGNPMAWVIFWNLFLRL